MDNNSIAQELHSIASELKKPHSDGLALLERLADAKHELESLNRGALERRHMLRKLHKALQSTSFKTQGSFLKFAEAVSNTLTFARFNVFDTEVLEKAKEELSEAMWNLHDVFVSGDSDELKRRGDIYRQVQEDLNNHFGKRLEV